MNDAKDAVLGRLAVFSANVLRGKNKPNYTPNQDCGDNLIIINSDYVHLTGKKAKDKILHNTNLKDMDVIIKTIKTKGDQVQDIRLSEVGGKVLFSKTIEKELQDKKIDIAVHALKDLPAIETEGLITDTFLVSWLPDRPQQMATQNPLGFR